MKEEKAPKETKWNGGKKRVNEMGMLNELRGETSDLSEDVNGETA